MTPNFVTLSVTFLPNFNFKCLSYDLYGEFTEIWYLFTGMGLKKLLIWGVEVG